MHYTGYVLLHCPSLSFPQAIYRVWPIGPYRPCITTLNKLCTTANAGYGLLNMLLPILLCMVCTTALVRVCTTIQPKYYCRKHVMFY